MNLFLDTNILLSFYHFTSDDLEELKKLTILLRKGKVCLLVPDQVKKEFRRNRENKIADALKRLRDQKLSLQFPQLCKGYAEYSVLTQSQKQYEEAHGKLLERIVHDVRQECLKADITINELFGSASMIQVDSDMLGRARLRSDIGDPPGKSGSLGDAINWEALIVTVPSGEDLYFITDDKDYCSPLEDDHFDYFLIDEWSNAKKSRLWFYKRLSSFFKAQFPDINLTSEIEAEKDLLIQDLVNSGSFASSHQAIKDLKQHDKFNSTQINDLVRAALENTQVKWILNDSDVREFFVDLIARHAGEVENSHLQQLCGLLGIGLETDDLPF